jgi:nucleotide-binding universal stress UspA family protein
MTMFKKILVACDGSEGSNLALIHAAILAGKLNAELAALWVRGSLPHYPETIDEIAEEEESAQTFFQSIQAQLDSVSVKHRIEIRAEMRKGDPAQQIVERAGQGAFDLIVLGSRGHSRLWGQLLGHTSDRVNEQAPCSVLIVRSEKEETRYRKMLVGFDGSEGSVAALYCALRLAQLIGSQVQVLWIHPVPPAGAENELREASDESWASDFSRTVIRDRIEGPASAPAVEIAAEYRSEKWASDFFETFIKDRIDRAASEHRVEIATGYRLGEPAHVLINEAQAGGFRLIVLGHSGRSGFWGRLLGGVADRVSHQAHCDVLIVRGLNE